MGVEEESQGYLTIKTHQGLYRYNRQVFEVASAPAIWQRSVGRILEGLEGTSCMTITGRDDEEHLDHLEKVLNRLKKHGLRGNRGKGELFQTTLWTRSRSPRTTQDSTESKFSR